MRTLSFAVLLSLAACDRHGRAPSAKPAPASPPAVSAGPSTAPPPVSARRDGAAHAVDVLTAAHGLADVRIATTRVWTPEAAERVVEWALSATHVATGRRVGIAGASVGDRIYADGETIRAQIGSSHAKVRPGPALPLHAEEYLVTRTPVEQRNLAAVHAMHDALVARDAAAFLGLLAEDVVHDDMSQPETSRGKSEAARFLALLPKTATFELGDAHAVGDWVIAETVQSGTEILSIWRFVDGRVHEGRSFPAYRSSIAAPARGGPNQ